METDNIKVIILEDNPVKTKEIDNVKIIRIKDKKYNLLIMKDYWPLLGEINGSVYLEMDDEIAYENIKGFYMLKNNIFHLIIREKSINND